jgi:hypothetical protein
VDKLLESISRLLPPGSTPLVAPDMRFHRAIGEFADKTYSVTGEKLSPEAYAKHVAEALPNEQEKAFVRALMKAPDWIAPRTDITTP